MTITYWCLLIAALIPYGLIFMAKAGAPTFNNHSPRIFLHNLTGWRARAHWAHLNGFEAFLVFLGGVFVAHSLGMPQALMDKLALVFISARILYSICYLTNKSTLRSLFWFVGFLSAIALYLTNG